MTTAHVPISYERIAAFCQRWHIELALYGPVLRDDFGRRAMWTCWSSSASGACLALPSSRSRMSCRRCSWATGDTQRQYLNGWLRKRTADAQDMQHDDLLPWNMLDTARKPER
jgi:hypothetical protein